MAGWFETHRAVVHQWQCDHLGHLNVRTYAHFFDDAGFHFWTGIPRAREIMTAHGIGVVVARTTNDFVHEARAGELVVINSALTRLGTKSLTYTQRLTNSRDRRPAGGARRGGGDLRPGAAQGGGNAGGVAGGVGGGVGCRRKKLARWTIYYLNKKVYLSNIF